MFHRSTLSVPADLELANMWSTSKKEVEYLQRPHTTTSSFTFHWMNYCVARKADVIKASELVYRCSEQQRERIHSNAEVPRDEDTNVERERVPCIS